MKIPADILRERQNKLSRQLEKNDLDAAAIVPGANLYYLTGVNLHLMERPSVLFLHKDGHIEAVMPELERSKWSEAVPAAETCYWQDSDGYDGAFAKIAAKSGKIRIGVEGQRMRVFEYEAMRRGFPDAVVCDAESSIAQIRICKDQTELDLIQKAVQISERALQTTIDKTEAGMSERQIQTMLKAAMLDGGSEGFAFEPIVLFGANAANPHGHPSDVNLLAPGEVMLIDFGASFGGYHADITRTFFCQRASRRDRKIYKTVMQANELGRSSAKPGITAHLVDFAVTRLMWNSPYSDLIVHRTGHGLGLNVHEEPQIMMKNRYQLEVGNVITIEPGLYEPGGIGVRIEDNVVITDSGSKSLTSFDRKLKLVG